MKAPWFIQVEGSEFGPLSEADLKNMISLGTVKGASFLWRGDFENWISAPTPSHLEALLGRYSGIDFEGKPILKRSLRHLPPGAERRRSERHPIIATAHIQPTGQSQILAGTCADISREGAQLILCEPFALKSGTELTVKIIPVSLLKMRAFELKGVIRWLHAAQNRVGLEFLPMDAEAQKSLDIYLKSQAAQTQV